jgi:hypothetical protein
MTMSDTKIIYRRNAKLVLTPDGIAEVQNPEESHGRARGLVLGLAFVLLAGAAILYFWPDYGDFQSSLAAPRKQVQRLMARLANDPGPAAPAAQRVALGQFTLKGIVYSPNRPVAMINDRVCERGQVVSVRAAREEHLIRCLDIEPEQVRIRTAGGGEGMLTLGVR